MKAIHKYQLQPQSPQRIELPAGAELLYAAEHFGGIAVYALVDAEADLVQRRLLWVVRTGDPIEFSNKAEALGVVALHGGALMLHIFAEPEGL